MIKRICIAMNREIRAKTNPNPKQGIMQDLTMGNRKVLLDNLEHARSLVTEGNHNALQDLEEIVDRAKNI
jgi:hypothetical protein